MLLSLWFDFWNWNGSASATATASISVSITATHSGGGGGHHRWFGHREYTPADDDYWAERERMLERHRPRAHEPLPERAKPIAEKHDRLLEQANEITALPDLAPLLHELDELSTQIRDIQLQSDDDEALLVLLLS